MGEFLMNGIHKHDKYLFVNAAKQPIPLNTLASQEYSLSLPDFSNQGKQVPAHLPGQRS